MTKDEIIAVLAILRSQHWVGPREAILNDTSYKLICSAIGKLERKLLTIDTFQPRMIPCSTPIYYSSETGLNGTFSASKRG